jgi:RNA polymerase sigma-70 factor (ECF subfamily)
MPDSHKDRFAKLFSESREALGRYIRGLGSSSDAAEEIVQEAFLRTYEMGEQVQTPRAFLFSTARNLTSDIRRHRRYAKTDSMGNVEDLDVCVDTGSPEERVLANEESRVLQEAVRRLPMKCRAVFALKLFHDCSCQEIADRLGLSTKTVENHVAKGLRETNRFLRRRYMDTKERV